MNSDPNAFIAKATQDFSRVFNATAIAFELDALQISKQMDMAAPRSTHKRSNGK